MYSRGERLARGWVIGSLATALAALSHAIAGGGAPSGLALVAGVIFGGMLGTVAVGRSPSLPRLAIAVGGTQLAFHALFSLLGTTGTAASSAGHDHGAAAPLTMVVGAPHPHIEGPEMWLAHAAAGLVTLALLRGAERAAWRLLTELARLVVARFRGGPRPHPVPLTRARAASSSPLGLIGRILTAGVSRRGPPVPIAF